MKETVPGDPRAIRLTLPGEVAAGFAGLAADLEARSQIVWGEHCSECAFPSCYSACAFYDPRPGDLHCRRFEAGIERLSGGPSLTRVRFRRWGKLEGRGPARLRAAQAAARLDRADRAVEALLDRPLPFAVRRSLAWRWNTRKARASVADAGEAHAFVVEAWSPGGREHDFTLTVLEQAGQRRMFQTSFRIGPDYRRLSVPIADVARAVDLGSPFLVQIEPVGEAQGIEVVFGVVDFVRTRPAASVTGTAPAMAPASAPLAKVVVWDLDETIWRGVLAEDGVEGLRLRPEAEAAIRTLDARGVLQSIASKNDEPAALAALAHFGLNALFLLPQIGWGPKSQSVERIARGLDLGLDAFVFIDDQAFERAEVATAHPTVRVLDEISVIGLPEHPWFDHPVTPESRSRRLAYAAEARRASEFQASGSDYLAFLESSAIELRIAPLTPAEATRVHELSQRTNQLNFRGVKYARETAEAMARPTRGRARWVLRCADRFGDYGLIGFADIDLTAGELSDFFMSCRVQRKRVENAFFAHLAEVLAAQGHAELTVRFAPTARNGASLRMLQELEFEPGEDGVWRRAVDRAFADAHVVRLSAPQAEAA